MNYSGLIQPLTHVNVTLRPTYQMSWRFWSLAKQATISTPTGNVKEIRSNLNTALPSSCLFFVLVKVLVLIRNTQTILINILLKLSFETAWAMLNNFTWRCVLIPDFAMMTAVSWNIDQLWAQRKSSLVNNFLLVGKQRQTVKKVPEKREKLPW